MLIDNRNVSVETRQSMCTLMDMVSMPPALGKG